MLFEFAIEPEVLFHASRSRRDYRDFIREFSIGMPNVISDYPRFKKFKSLVLTAIPADFGDNDFSRLEELIGFIRDTLRVMRSSEYDRALTWIDNLRAEAARVPFDHVLTTNPDTALPCSSVEQLCDGSIGHPRQLLVKRTADNMAASIANMLRLSSRIIFVDPYFRDRPPSWTPFIKFVEAAVTNKPSDVINIEVLFSATVKNAPTAVYLATKFRDERSELAGKCYLTFKAVEEKIGREKLHNRYVLTDIGGVFFGVGLAEEDQAHHDDVSLLDTELYNVRWRQYADLTEFRLVEESAVLI